jgi:hypothetical protein
VEPCLRRDEGMMAEDIGIDPETAGVKVLRLLFVLAFGFPAHFMTEDVLSRLVNILSLDSQIIVLVPWYCVSSPLLGNIGL